jgi:hypothetical protein
MTYRPLPEYLTIKESKIEGLGLCATQDIESSKYIGITHLKDEQYIQFGIEGIWPNNLIRTPLGGFINHSEDPNCELKETDGVMHLSTIKDISSNEELTVKYKTYKV